MHLSGDGKVRIQRGTKLLKYTSKKIKSFFEWALDNHRD